MLLALSSLACAKPQAVESTQSMLDSVAVGQNRCPDEDGDARPFVVEWDATDLATFEAKAGRDIVFVHYEGCEIEMLYGCSDNSVPGRYGAYERPVFTSGTVESFEIHDQAELWAKLPLGAEAVGAQVSAGSTLELQYYVSGTATSTRNYVERATIADNGRCDQATHFVSAYNLGAFRLLAHERDAKHSSSGVAGSKAASDSTKLKNGGDIDDCTSRTQQRCRVPIRLVLQEIDETATASDDAPKNPDADVRPDPEPAPAEDTVSARAAKLREAALAKADARDAAGCLEDLDRADALIDDDETRKQSVYIRAVCTMLTDCDAGVELFHEYIEMIDTNKEWGKYDVIAATTQRKKAYCPIEQLDPEFAATVLFERARDGARSGQPARCTEVGEQALPLVSKLDKLGSVHASTAKDAVYEVARCFSLLSRCDESKRWYVEWRMLYNKDNAPKATVKKDALEMWAKDLQSECEM